MRVAALARLEEFLRAAIRTHGPPHGSRCDADALVERALEAADSPLQVLRERLTKRQESLARVGGDWVNGDHGAVGCVRESCARVLLHHVTDEVGVAVARRLAIGQAEGAQLFKKALGAAEGEGQKGPLKLRTCVLVRVASVSV